VTSSAGAMVDRLDGRVRLTQLDVNLGQKQAWTYSLDVKIMECIGCKQHFNQQPFPRRGTNVRGCRQAIWVSDHSMPPILPTKTTQQCIKIIRLDCGTLQELTEGLVRVLAGRHITAGSVILMTSATHMRATGTAAYAEDLLDAIKFLRRSLGDHLVYGPLPNMLLDGCDDQPTIRSVFEISRWAELAFGNLSAHLHNSFGLVERQLRARGEDGVQHVQRCTLRLPLATPRPDGSKTVVVVAGEDHEIPCKINGATVAEESAVVESIVMEIREKHAIDLDLKPVINRWPDVTAARLGAGNVRNFLLIGSSHASKLASSLRKQGHNTGVIYESNWRVIRDNTLEMADKIQEKLQRDHVDAVIFCVIDNNIYGGLDTVGNPVTATRGEDGKFHISGDLIVVSKSAQHAIFNAIRPMLDAARGRNCILASPLPRYLYKGCCTDVEHITNRTGPFRQHLRKDLKDAADNLRDFCFTTGYKMIKILDPAVSWQGTDDDQLWGDDPIHPTELAYTLMANSVNSMVTGMESGGKKRARTNSIETGEPGPQATLNRAAGRGRGGPPDRSGRGGQRGRRYREEYQGPQAKRSFNN
jgi:hypothetical protein